MKLATTAAFVGTILFLDAGEAVSTVRFSNNDRLSGSIESLSPDMLLWKSSILEKPTPFFLKNVLELTLAAEQPQSIARHEAAISLTNGDMLRGQLASISDDVIGLDTWFAGRLQVNRLMISEIKITELPDLIYRGPTGLDDWKQSGDKPAWTYQNGCFRSSAPGNQSSSWT